MTTKRRLISPDALLREAEQQDAIDHGPFAYDYGRVVQELRDKNFGWAEITSFFFDHNLPFSTQSLMCGWKRWAREQDEKIAKIDAHMKRADELMTEIG